MAWIFVDKDSESGGSQQQMRSQMRRNMRSGGYRSYGGGNSRDDYRDGYRQGYKHGWEDKEEDDDDMEYRRSRDSRGRYV